MDIWKVRSTNGNVVNSTYPGLNSIILSRVTVNSNSIPSSGATYTITTPSITTNTTTISSVNFVGATVGTISRQSPFPRLNSDMAGSVAGCVTGSTGSVAGSVAGSTGSMASSQSYSSMNSTALTNISPNIPNTKLPCTVPVSSSSSYISITATAVSTAKPTIDENTTDGTVKRQRLDHLTVEQKVLRRKVKTCGYAKSARERMKTKQAHLDSTVDRLTAEKVKLAAQRAKLQSELQVMESEFALALSSSQSLTNNTCASCKHLHLQ